MDFSKVAQRFGQETKMGRGNREIGRKNHKGKNGKISQELNETKSTTKKIKDANKDDHDVICAVCYEGEQRWPSWLYHHWQFADHPTFFYCQCNLRVHPQCLDRWLQEGQTSCPYCRRQLKRVLLERAGWCWAVRCCVFHFLLPLVCLYMLENVCGSFMHGRSNTLIREASVPWVIGAYIFMLTLRFKISDGLYMCILFAFVCFSLMIRRYRVIMWTWSWAWVMSLLTRRVYNEYVEQARGGWVVYPRTTRFLF